jgi:hypothetical protein
MIRAAYRGAGPAGARPVSRCPNATTFESLEARRLMCMSHGTPFHPPIHEDVAALSAKSGGGLNSAPSANDPADIVWVNRASTTTGGPADTDGFGRVFGTTAPRARAVIDAVLVEYERMIGSFNYATAGQSYSLNLSMSTDPGNPWGGGAGLWSDLAGKPKSGGIVLSLGNNSPEPNDDNGWFLDPTPFESSEFNGNILNAFAGEAAQGSPAFGRWDFYTVACAELTHCMGLFGNALPGWASHTVNTGVADNVSGPGYFWAFDGPSIKHLLTSDNGGSQDWGSAIHGAKAPGKVHFNGLEWYGADDQGNPAYSMNQRYTVNDTFALMFKDAYDYSSVNPAKWNSMYSLLNETTKAVTVRGGDFANGFPNSNDHITVTRSGNTISVSVDAGSDVPGTGALPGTGDLPAWVTEYDISEVSSINIDAGAGNDVITVGTNVGVPITVNGGTGTNTLVAEGTSLGDNVLVRFDGFTSGATVVTATNFNSMTVNGNDGGDNVSVREIDANRPLTVNLGADLDILTLTDANAHNYGALITVDGGGGGDTNKLFIVDTALAGTSTYTVTTNSLTKDNGFGGVSFTNLRQIFINGETGSNVVNVSSTATGMGFYMDGGATADTYNVMETGPNSAGVITSGAGGDTLNVNTDNTGSAQVQFLNSIALRDLTLGVNGRATMTPHGGHVLMLSGNFWFNGNGSILDMNDNDFIYDYSGSTVYQGILNPINWARAGGSWNGTTGMTSSPARVNPQHNTTLGIMESRDYKTLYGANATFDGQAIDDTAILVKYTYYGDADFNGKVNFDDYVRADSGFSNHKTGWFNGDFDGNGQVNFDDYVLMDLAFSTQSGIL